MATTIHQEPLYGGAGTSPIPVGQKILFTIGNGTVVSNHYNVKFVAEVHVSNLPITISANTLKATFKTTPNNKGRGIFDFQNFLESYVSSDNLGINQSFLGGSNSRYKNVVWSNEVPHPIHVIDKLCQNRNSLRYFRIRFSIEGSTTAISPVITIANTEKDSIEYKFFNGVLHHDNYLTKENQNYGYDLISNNLLTPAKIGAKFLTNAPTTQYANKTDYGTMAFLQYLPASHKFVKFITFTWYDSSGSTLGTQVLNNNWTNGGSSSGLTNSIGLLNYFGAYPGNLRNWITAFDSDIDDISYYTVQASSTFGGTSLFTGQLYTININCPDTKGFESVRLCWLNQWGVWDYYTFTKKSVRSTSTNRTTYTQTSGTWNEDEFRIDGFKGGRKNFRVNSTERFQINTDFITEEQAKAFEDLVASPEVYMLNGFDSTETAPYTTITNKYVEPVLLTTSSYIRKTIANDKLMQYTFDLERNTTQRTQTS